VSLNRTSQTYTRFFWLQSSRCHRGNPKACFWAGAASAADAQMWREQVAKHSGSWWPHWLEWIKARSGALMSPPAALGSEQNPPLEAAPGRYVMER
jgi:polyhydroxyalkanoate synthase subunit PhaC